MLAVIAILEKNVISERIKEILEHLKKSATILHKIHNDSGYRDLTKNHINWS